MSHKLGVYFAPNHDWASTWDYIQRLQPPVVRILFRGADAGVVSRVYQTVPNARISLRWWDIDDGGEDRKLSKLNNPEASGAADAREVLARIEIMERVSSSNGVPFPRRARLLANTQNDPPIWNPCIRAKVVANNRSFIAGLIPHGIPVAAGCINTGHPSEWPPVWDWYEPVIDLIKMSPGSCLELHSYWQLEGPNYTWKDGDGKQRVDWGALAGRYQHCPFDVPILIGECGADGRLYDRRPAHTGWLGNLSAVQYAEQLRWYHVQITQDKRILAMLPFLTDYQSDEWATFDTTSAHEEILAWTTHPSPTVYIPTLPNDGPTPPVAMPPTPQPPLASAIIDPAALEAILEVESNGAGFINQRMVIRFEAHIFAGELQNTPLYNKHFRHNDAGRPWLEQFWRLTQADTWRAVHTGHQDSEWTAFEFARSLNETAAMRSISMGAPQIMGFNHLRIGYSTVQAMFAAFDDSYPAQLIGLVNFVLSDAMLVDAIRRRDWRTVAKLYNGPGQVDVYVPRLEKAYREASA